MSNNFTWQKIEEPYFGEHFAIKVNVADKNHAGSNVDNYKNVKVSFDDLGQAHFNFGHVKLKDMYRLMDAVNEAGLGLSTRHDRTSDGLETVVELTEAHNEMIEVLLKGFDIGDETVMRSKLGEKYLKEAQRYVEHTKTVENDVFGEMRDALKNGSRDEWADFHKAHQKFSESIKNSATFDQARRQIMQEKIGKQFEAANIPSPKALLKKILLQEALTGVMQDLGAVSLTETQERQAGRQ